MLTSDMQDEYMWPGWLLWKTSANSDESSTENSELYPACFAASSSSPPPENTEPQEPSARREIRRTSDLAGVMGDLPEGGLDLNLLGRFHRFDDVAVLVVQHRMAAASAATGNGVVPSSASVMVISLLP